MSAAYASVTVRKVWHEHQLQDLERRRREVKRDFDALQAARLARGQGSRRRGHATVTADDIVRRNRANAAKSTGPRTRAGKAIVAQNARRHGATAKLDPDQVRLWLKVILAAPDLGPRGC